MRKTNSVFILRATVVLTLSLVVGCTQQPDAPLALGQKSPEANGSPGSPESTAADASLTVPGDLTRAAFVGNMAKVLELLQLGADVNEQVGLTGEKISPLMAAVVGGHREVALALLSKGADQRTPFQRYSIEALERHRCLTYGAPCWVRRSTPSPAPKKP